MGRRVPTERQKLEAIHRLTILEEANANLRRLRLDCGTRGNHTPAGWQPAIQQARQPALRIRAPRPWYDR